MPPEITVSGQDTNSSCLDIQLYSVSVLLVNSVCSCHFLILTVTMQQNYTVLSFTGNYFAYNVLFVYLVSQFRRSVIRALIQAINHMVNFLTMYICICTQLNLVLSILLSMIFLTLVHVHVYVLPLVCTCAPNIIICKLSSFVCMFMINCACHV